LEERHDYLARHPLEELTPYTISDRRLLLQQLEHAPRAVERQEYALGFSCLAVPVRAPGVAASLAVSVPTGSRADIDELATRMQGVANRLSLRLGTDRFGGRVP